MVQEAAVPPVPPFLLHLFSPCFPSSIWVTIQIRWQMGKCKKNLYMFEGENISPVLFCFLPYLWPSFFCYSPDHLKTQGFGRIQGHQWKGGSKDTNGRNAPACALNWLWHGWAKKLESVIWPFQYCVLLSMSYHQLHLRGFQKHPEWGKCPLSLLNSEGRDGKECEHDIVGVYVKNIHDAALVLQWRMSKKVWRAHRNEIPGSFFSRILEHTLTMLQRSVCLLSLFTNSLASVKEEEADVSHH